MTVREARPADAPALAAAHVEAWQATYRGMLPDAYLESLTAHDRLPWWQDRLAAPERPGSTVLVAEDSGGTVCGFGSLWPSPNLPSGTVELPQIYLVPRAWGQGLGRLLMAGLLTRAEGAGFSAVVLWVHPGNSRARRFYEAGGWGPTGADRSEEVWGVTVPEVQYGISLAGLSRTEPAWP
jgi:GNAT superfamily N-acetyltransferase